MPTTFYDFRNPQKGDIYLDNNEVILTVVSVNSQTIQITYEVSFLAGEHMPDNSVIGGIQIMRKFWDKEYANTMSLYLCNRGNIPHEAQELNITIQETQEEYNYLIEKLTVPLWMTGFHPDIADYVTFTPIGIVPNFGFAEFGEEMGFSSPHIASLRSDIIRRMGKLEHLLTQLVNYRFGGKTPEQIMDEDYE